MCRRSPSRPAAFSRPSLPPGMSRDAVVSPPNLADESLFRETPAPVSHGEEETRHRERQINLRRRAGYATVLYKRIYIVPTVPACHNPPREMSSPLPRARARTGDPTWTTRRLRRCTCMSHASDSSPTLFYLPVDRESAITRPREISARPIAKFNLSRISLDNILKSAKRP